MNRQPPTNNVDDRVAVEDFAASIVNGQAQRTRQKLTADRTRTAALDLARGAMGDVSLLGDQSPDTPRRACRAGCSACCHIAVSITPLEALHIAGRLAETLPADRLALLRAKMTGTSRQVSHLTIEQRARARIPCALLSDEGECTIHDFRPIGCRGWTSFSKEVCDRALESHQPGHDGPVDRVALTVAGCVTEGLEIGLRSLGIDAVSREFHSAILQALSTPNAAERWAAGEDVFNGCPRVTSDRLRPRGSSPQ